MEQDKERLRVLAKIKELEETGQFDVDPENDPPAKVIKPGTVDYKQKKLSTRIKAKITFGLARKFLHKLIKNKQFIVKNVVGVENLDNLDSGAVLTCNHFSAMDSFATQVVYEKSIQSKKRKLFRVIKEGNYTSYPGFYGSLMRNCNTLPLSSDFQTLQEFLRAASYHLTNGNYVLIYPEQSMWWNYRKPKPLKSGAYTMAVHANVPVVPIFICMEDSDVIGPDGFPIQMYTIFVLKPIFEDPELSSRENKEMMAKKNYEAWKAIYETFYNEKLEYLCDKQ
jgi:1-acyl-sn-glycerol-3-phosphate acyltransferase